MLHCVDHEVGQDSDDKLRIAVDDQIRRNVVICQHRALTRTKGRSCHRLAKDDHGRCSLEFDLWLVLQPGEFQDIFDSALHSSSLPIHRRQRVLIPFLPAVLSSPFEQEVGVTEHAADVVLQIVDKELGHAALRLLEFAKSSVLSFQLTTVLSVDLELSGEIVSLETDDRSVIPIHSSDDERKDGEHQPHRKHRWGERLDCARENRLPPARPSTKFEPRECGHRHRMEHDVPEHQSPDRVDGGRSASIPSPLIFRRTGRRFARRGYMPESVNRRGHDHVGAPRDQPGCCRAHRNRQFSRSDEMRRPANL